MFGNQMSAIQHLINRLNITRHLNNNIPFKYLRVPHDLNTGLVCYLCLKLKVWFIFVKFESIFGVLEYGDQTFKSMSITYVKDHSCNGIVREQDH